MYANTNVLPNPHIPMSHQCDQRGIWRKTTEQHDFQDTEVRGRDQSKLQAGTENVAEP